MMDTVIDYSKYIPPHCWIIGVYLLVTTPGSTSGLFQDYPERVYCEGIGCGRMVDGPYHHGHRSFSLIARGNGYNGKELPMPRVCRDLANAQGC